MTTFRTRIARVAAATALIAAAPFAAAAEYAIDPGHSFVEFRIQHLGFSWLYGRFNEMSGGFRHDPANPETSAIEVEIDTASIDTNHAERDKHLRSSDFLDVERHPKAAFRTTGYSGSAEQGTMTGELTLHGVTKPITLEVKKLGEGEDPWGGYRAGFVATTVLDRRDFGIDYDLGPAGWTMEMELGIEGVRK